MKKEPKTTTPKPTVHRLRKPSKFIVQKQATISARHDFTNEELLEISRSFNAAYQKKKSLEMEKKAISADFGSQIKQVDTQLEAIGQRSSNGFDYRDTPCMIEFDYKNRKKLYFRTDREPAEFVKEEMLSDADCQACFEFADKPQADPVDGKIVSVEAAFSEAEQSRKDEAKSLKARRDLLEENENKED